MQQLNTILKTQFSYWLTSNGGPQFAGANAAIKTWCEEASILHTLSTAFNPEGNGEAERVVQAMKKVISHAGDDLKSMQSCVTNINHDQILSPRIFQIHKNYIN